MKSNWYTKILIHQQIKITCFQLLWSGFYFRILYEHVHKMNTFCWLPYGIILSLGGNHALHHEGGTFVIQLKKVNKVYDDGFHALKDIDLTFEEGQINVLI